MLTLGMCHQNSSQQDQGPSKASNSKVAKNLTSPLLMADWSDQVSGITRRGRSKKHHEPEEELNSFELRHFFEDPLANKKAKPRVWKGISYGKEAVRTIREYIGVDSESAGGMFWLWWGRPSAPDSQRKAMGPAAEEDFERHTPYIMTSGNVCYTKLSSPADWKSGDEEDH